MKSVTTFHKKCVGFATTKVNPSSGTTVTRKLLSPPNHPAKIASVKVLTRNPDSAKAKALASYGAEIVKISNVTAADLKGVDILINTMGHETSDADKNPFGTAAVEAGVKVYIPSEYGM